MTRASQGSVRRRTSRYSNVTQAIEAATATNRYGSWDDIPTVSSNSP